MLYLFICILDKYLSMVCQVIAMHTVKKYKTSLLSVWSMKKNYRTMRGDGPSEE